MTARQGILALNKPAGMTSHDCVAKIRRIFSTKKVGHTGTLDPEVTGVLPICIGRATKIAEYMSDYGKEYIGEVTLGFSTETEDAHGAKVSEKPVTEDIPFQVIEDILKSMTGEIEQIPPMYSAVKVNGKKLYEYARQGISVERPRRKVTIHELELLNSDKTLTKELPVFSFRVKCSKGTYVRTLAVEIGERLGLPAHMSNLIRTASGPFTIDECVTFEQLESGDIPLDEYLVPLEKGIAHFPKWTVSDEWLFKIKNGSVLEAPKELEQSPFGVYNEEGKCLAIYEFHPSKPGLIKPVKVLAID
ncbi:tRNA pseudouridine(55) synthase TruB [Fictibacillus barbaricus]|uniref:tRNA pseudouridine synthase B n=1 Tax=Fictibacillus barbaricus TaxID=182136 RepID=A0ABS2ZDN6_9BACL|nr:tRNA pseudouridine(55) synthase TruB [Fictibacillus barbaricus]MBN3545802.1 tRNA pseudouridine(55) synthase TruB [Fictibacillus barbaricus]GGB56229.1 tRNA pseudouridine synthase B [Fictibacillus barbaricus]